MVEEEQDRDERRSSRQRELETGESSRHDYLCTCSANSHRLEEVELRKRTLLPAAAAYQPSITGAGDIREANLAQKMCPQWRQWCLQPTECSFSHIDPQPSEEEGKLLVAASAASAGQDRRQHLTASPHIPASPPTLCCCPRPMSALH
eukprot:762132-Hanusia_phi.AAC.1